MLYTKKLRLYLKIKKTIRDKRHIINISIDILILEKNVFVIVKTIKDSIKTNIKKLSD